MALDSLFRRNFYHYQIPPQLPSAVSCYIEIIFSSHVRLDIMPVHQNASLEDEFNVSG